MSRIVGLTVGISTLYVAYLPFAHFYQNGPLTAWDFLFLPHRLANVVALEQLYSGRPEDPGGTAELALGWLASLPVSLLYAAMIVGGVRAWRDRDRPPPDSN